MAGKTKGVCNEAITDKGKKIPEGRRGPARRKEKRNLRRRKKGVCPFFSIARRKAFLLCRSTTSALDAIIL